MGKVTQEITFDYPEIGVCGLSCRLCPAYHRETKSRCPGCKTEYRMGYPCPFVRCALKKGIEFCWDCDEGDGCRRWRKRREFSRGHDTAKSYQTLEPDIAYVKRHGVAEFDKLQKMREKLLASMLSEFNEGRSKNYYSVVATVMEIGELKGALAEGRQRAKGLDIKEKARLLHSILDEIAAEKNYILRLRK